MLLEKSLRHHTLNRVAVRFEATCSNILIAQRASFLEPFYFFSPGTHVAQEVSQTLVVGGDVQRIGKRWFELELKCILNVGRPMVRLSMLMLLQLTWISPITIAEPNENHASLSIRNALVPMDKHCERCQSYLDKGC